MIWRIEFELLSYQIVDVEAETKEQAYELIKKYLKDINADYITISYLGVLQ